MRFILRHIVINLCMPNKKTYFCSQDQYWAAMEKNPHVELAESILSEEMVEYFEVVGAAKTPETLLKNGIT